jgi:type IV secretory pathway VirB10-like protein
VLPRDPGDRRDAEVDRVREAGERSLRPALREVERGERDELGEADARRVVRDEQEGPLGQPLETDEARPEEPAHERRERLRPARHARRHAPRPGRDRAHSTSATKIASAASA